VCGRRGGRHFCDDDRPRIEALAKGWIPFAPADVILAISPAALARCSLLALVVGALAALPGLAAARNEPALAAKFGMSLLSLSLNEWRRRPLRNV